MPDFKFSDLKDLVNVLCDSYYVPDPAKIKLAELLEDVLQLKGKETPGRGNIYIKKQNKK